MSLFPGHPGGKGIPLKHKKRCMPVLRARHGLMLGIRQQMAGAVSHTWDVAVDSCIEVTRNAGLTDPLQQVANVPPLKIGPVFVVAPPASALLVRVAQRRDRHSCGQNLASDCSVLSTA